MSTKKRDIGTRINQLEEGAQRAKPVLHQHAKEIQPYGKIAKLSIALDETACESSINNLNQILADTMTLRDMYKKHHWQVAGATFYQLHLLFDKHHGEQDELVDTIAERIQLLGGVSIAMAADVAETTIIPRPPRGREEVPVQISRLLEAHEFILKEARTMARRSLRSRRRWHQRSAGERRDSRQRVAGLVPLRASGGHAAARIRSRPRPRRPGISWLVSTARNAKKISPQRAQRTQRNSGRDSFSSVFLCAPLCPLC